MLNPDFHDMLSALCDEEVDFLLVGAYALAVHGLPRATGDIDIWIRRSDDNADRTWRALRRFGTPLLDLSQGGLPSGETGRMAGLRVSRNGCARRAGAPGLVYRLPNPPGNVS